MKLKFLQALLTITIVLLFCAESHAILVTVDFEELDHRDAISTYYSTYGIVFDENWAAIVKESEGGEGRFDNEPSSITAAMPYYFPAAPEDPTVISNIYFSSPINYVGFYQASSGGVTLRAFDSDGIQVGEVFGGDNYTGYYDVWDYMSLNLDASLISSVQIIGG